MSTRLPASAMRPVHSRLSLVLGLVAGGSIAAVILHEASWGEWRLVSEPLHAAVEALGALAAILTALFLVQGERGQRSQTLFFPAMGFLAMGLLELFHATASGQAVVFLRGSASAAGGLGFVLVWLRLPAPSVATAWKKALAGLVAAASVLLGLWSLAATDSLPLMVRDGRFTGMAVGLNVSAGLLFLAGAARLVIDSRTLASPIIPPFATVATLFGAAGLMFPFSTLWDSGWWTWHLVRLAAYLLALVFMVREHQQRAVVLGAILDEQRKVEAALRDAELRYRTLFEQSPDGLLLVDPETGLTLEFNEAAHRQLGYSREEFAQLRINDYEAIEKPEETRGRIERVLAEGRHEFETRHRSKHGELRSVFVTVQTIHLSGRPVFHCVFRDITERKQAEAALAIQASTANAFVTVDDDQMFNEVLKVILDVMHSPFGVFGYLDEAGALVVPTMTRQIWDKCQVPEKSITFPRETWGDSSWPRAIREKKSNYSNEVSTKTPQGHVIVQRHISVPILFQGEVIGLLQVANKETDYTAADIGALEAIAGQVAPLLSARLRRERAQEALHKLNAELEQRVHERTAQLEAANQELEAFSYSASHDLRAPLRAIDGFGRILLEDHAERLDGEGQRVLGVISSETRRMGRLIDDLLGFSRLGRQKLESSAIDMTGLAEAVFGEEAARFPKRALHLELKPLPPAHGDRAMIRVVLGNLLSNAIKFTKPREPAVIEVGSRQHDGQAVYYVKDNGVGFDMKYAHKLFSVFQRLHSAEEFEGTGVGLALVQRVIHRHGGRVWAEGQVNEGAAFCFSLPSMKEEP